MAHRLALYFFSFSDMPRKSLQVCASVRVTQTTCNRLGVFLSVCSHDTLSVWHSVIAYDIQNLV